MDISDLGQGAKFFKEFKIFKNKDLKKIIEEKQKTVITIIGNKRKKNKTTKFKIGGILLAELINKKIREMSVNISTDGTDQKIITERLNWFQSQEFLKLFSEKINIRVNPDQGAASYSEYFNRLFNTKFKDWRKMLASGTPTGECSKTIKGHQKQENHDKHVKRSNGKKKDKVYIDQFNGTEPCYICGEKILKEPIDDTK
jgi:hypothetical protein